MEAAQNIPDISWKTGLRNLDSVKANTARWHGKVKELPAIDGGTVMGARFRTLYDELVSDLGGPDFTSRAQKQLARRAAMLGPRPTVLTRPSGNRGVRPDPCGQSPQPRRRPCGVPRP
jgi:hypothetical protein